MFVEKTCARKSALENACVHEMLGCPCIKSCGHLAHRRRKEREKQEGKVKTRRSGVVVGAEEGGGGGGGEKGGEGSGEEKREGRKVVIRVREGGEQRVRDGRR